MHFSALSNSSENNQENNRFSSTSFMGRFLDSDHRRRIQRPDKIIERSGIKESMKVLKIGCGSGAFTIFVARAVSKNGKVFALDI